MTLMPHLTHQQAIAIMFHVCLILIGNNKNQEAHLNPPIGKRILTWVFIVIFCFTRPGVRHVTSLTHSLTYTKMQTIQSYTLLILLEHLKAKKPTG
jgi:hypothetical protein